VVPQGGNTGLVGGSVPIADEIILSTKQMNRIEGFVGDGILQCESGCILQELQDYAAERSLLVPVDLGAKGSCCIGGNVSTNAGGQYYYRYGSLHANVVGLEVVLPSGEVLNLLSTNLKDNTGYDLKHLFIGAEGTLGVVTRVTICCPRMPSARNAVFLGCTTFQDVQKTLLLAKDCLGEILAAFEFMDEGVLDLVRKKKRIPVTRDDTGHHNYPYCVLLETHGFHMDHDMEKMEDFFDRALEEGIVVDGVLAQDMRQVQQMWEVRESCGPIVASAGCLYKYDVSLPIAHFDDFTEEMRQRLSDHPKALVVNWGHVVDGNLHFNVVTPGVFDEDPSLTARIEPYLFESVNKRGGSISAEHGLGQCKNKYLPMVKERVTLKMMKSVKDLLDPHGILNPGKYLPAGKQPY